VKRAAAFLAVAHSVGFGAPTTVLLGLTPQALCCRLLRRLKTAEFNRRWLDVEKQSRPPWGKTHGKIQGAANAANTEEKKP